MIRLLPGLAHCCNGIATSSLASASRSQAKCRPSGERNRYPPISRCRWEWPGSYTLADPIPNMAICSVLPIDPIFLHLHSRTDPQPVPRRGLCQRKDNGTPSRHYLTAGSLLTNRSTTQERIPALIRVGKTPRMVSSCRMLFGPNLL